MTERFLEELHEVADARPDLAAKCADLDRELRELAAALRRGQRRAVLVGPPAGRDFGTSSTGKPTAAKSRPAGGDLLDATMPRPHTSVRAAQGTAGTKYEVRSTEYGVGKNHRREPEPEVAQGRSRGVCMKWDRQVPDRILRSSVLAAAPASRLPTRPEGA